MNVSSTYLSYIDGFSDVDPYAISSKYSMYMLVSTGDNGEPIAIAITSAPYVGYGGQYMPLLDEIKIVIYRGG